MIQEIKTITISWWNDLKNKRCCCFFYIILLLVWFPWIFQRETHIDTEVLINSPKDSYNWLDIGRQGAILTKYLFNMQWFNPFFERLIGYLTLCAAGIVFCYLFEHVTRKSYAINAAFGLICFTAPIMAEQLYFDLQIFEIAWAYVLCAISVGLSYISILKKDVRYCSIAILAMIWMFCTYQIFVVLYVIVAVTCFILLYKRWTIEEQREDMHYWKIVGQLIAMFAVAIAINSVITNVFFSSSDYLSAQISWKTLSTDECISNIITHIKEGVLGIGTFYTPIYGILAILSMATVLIQTFTKQLKMGWLLFLAVTVLQLTPFLLTIFIGKEPDVRAQLAYPMVLASNLLILVHFVEWNKVLHVIILMLAVVLCWTQIQTTQRLIYTDAICAQEDMRLASAVEQRLNNLTSQKKPIAFIGSYYNKLNQSCLRGVLIGRSIFCMDAETIPHYYFSSDRACRILQSMGIDIQSVSQEQMIEARQLARSMQSWPATGSVIDAGEFIVVKLSDDQWQEELIELSLIEFSPQEGYAQFVTDDSLALYVDKVAYDNEQLIVNGWAYLEDVDSLTVEPGIFLYDSQADIFYQLSTVRKRRVDVVEVSGNPLYEYSGIWAAVPSYMLEKRLEEYKLYVGINYENQWYLRLADISLSSVP